MKLAAAFRRRTLRNASGKNRFLQFETLSQDLQIKKKRKTTTSLVKKFKFGFARSLLSLVSCCFFLQPCSSLQWFVLCGAGSLEEKFF